MGKNTLELQIPIKAKTNERLSSKQKSIFIFEGVNKSNVDAIFVSARPSCGCTSPSQPLIIKAGENFAISLAINKINQSGFTSQMVRFKYQNAENMDEIVEFELKVSGNII
jgi:hypothetical protein